MKVYNIRNGKAFFEELAACEGAVEMVNEEGKHLQLTAGGETPDLIPMTYFRGEIKEMELTFQKSEDCSKILAYLLNKRDLAA